MPHILLVDDDVEILSLLTSFLEKHSHKVTVAETGTEMFAAHARQPADLIILDVMLRNEDGFGILHQLRASSRTPVIMLTSLSDHTDRVVGLEIGADDYITKPFDQRELLARVKAVLRRTGEAPAPSAPGDMRLMLKFAGWRLDVARRELWSEDDTLVILSGGEFDLLLVFAEHPQRVLTRDQLLDMARGPTHAVFDRSIDVQVSRLRYKMETDPKNPILLRTIRNGGYMFTPAVTRG